MDCYSNSFTSKTESTWLQNPKDRTLHSHSPDNLKSKRIFEFHVIVRIQKEILPKQNKSVLFVVETRCIFCEVRVEFLNMIQTNFNH